jgi:hypothetical protein
MARHFPLALALALLISLLVPLQVQGATLSADVEQPIDNGLAWLVLQQNPDGSFGEFMRVQQTSLAVMKMLDRARELGKNPFQEDPQAADYYMYHSQVENGLDFIMSKVQKANPEKPEDPVNGDIGSIWDAHEYILGPDPQPPSIVIETSTAILALTSTGTPEATWTGEEGTVTYYQVVENAVMYLKRAQLSDLVKGENGGWPPLYQDLWLMPPCVRPPGEQICLDHPIKSNQWNTGIATLALYAAEREFGIPMGDEVRDGLKIWVLGGIQNTDETSPDFGGSYTWIPNPENPDETVPTTLLTTGFLLFEQKEAGLNKGDPGIKLATQFLENKWGLYQPADPWNYETLYATMRGLDAWKIRSLKGEDWFSVFTMKILREQDPVDGSWAGIFDDPPFNILPTDWALLVLEGHAKPRQLENRPPVSADDSFETGQDIPLTVLTPGVLGNDMDPDLDTITAIPVTGPVHGVLTLNPDGSFTYIPEISFLGVDFFSYRASDGYDESSAATVGITVNPVDEPPDVPPVRPSLACLWPPNHTYAEVTLLGITDPDSDPVTIHINTVMSDEPRDVTGAGGKSHNPDAVITGDVVSLLRAERSGSNNGRVYTISFTATDADGGRSDGFVTVCVPHDQRSDCTCVDDKSKYDATVVP